MSSFAATPAQLARSARADQAAQKPAVRSGVKGLAAMFLAAAVAALVVVADRVIDTWADEHLFYAWVLLWAVVFAGLALFAGATRQLAQRVMPWLDGWSKAIAETRAEMRVWEAAQRDPRLMQELVAARQRDADDTVAFEQALSPIGLEPAAAVTTPAFEATADGKVKMLGGRAYNLYYI